MSFDRRGRFAVLAGGISIGSEEITAGTLTGKFIDMKDGSEVMVSNYHVFWGKPGETKIVQPGPYDGGRVPEDVVGILKRVIELDRHKELPWWKKILCIFFGWLLEEWCYPEMLPNHLDAAVATFNPTDTSRTLLKGVYLDDGTRLEIQETHPGDGINGKKVWKSGRTTGITKGTVVNDKATVKVWYGTEWKKFEDVVIVEGEARGGDSGSPVFLSTNEEPSGSDKLCGILFAGSAKYWVHCKYKYLEEDLKVKWAT